MKGNALEKYFNELKGSEGDDLFGPDALVFKGIGQIFALVSQKDKPARITLKCSPACGEVLVN